ncbi:TadE/TadG family type IV pilus assembly protein [Sphingomonadaceae bacterium jetA1]|uniref:TadE/TadG family type IV pilus assembly protein n=1 Tax=Facivitalis istanbulensis TaxID=3075838 RepID=UPI003494B426
MSRTRLPRPAILRDRRGVALVEFAITAPVILLLGLGGIELSNFIVANMQISQIAMSVADNAGRVRTSIDEADITELMIGALKMGEPLGLSTHGRIILSDLEQRTNGAVNGAGLPQQWIRWQRCAGALRMPSSLGGPLDRGGQAVADLDSGINEDHGAVETASTLTGMGPAGNQIAAAPGTALMVVEVVYDYQPIAPVSFLNAVVPNPRIRRVMAFNVRQRTAYSLRNDAKLSGVKRADCRLFDRAVPTA